VTWKQEERMKKFCIVYGDGACKSNVGIAAA